MNLHLDSINLNLAFIIAASEHAKPVMSGDACTQLSVPSWCQRQRTGLGLIQEHNFLYVFFVGTQ